jgi:putative ABC transport system permease protein
LVTLGAFSAIGMLLVVIGIFSVMAYSVSLRTREIGIRMALGAQGRTILHMVIGKGLRLVAAGVAIGLFLSYGATRLLSSEISGISSSDPLTFAVVAVIVVTVGLLACYVPAQRATRVDPLVALRYE